MEIKKSVAFFWISEKILSIFYETIVPARILHNTPIVFEMPETDSDGLQIDRIPSSPVSDSELE